MGTGSLAWGYASLGLHTVVHGIGVLGAGWLISVWRRWRWFSAPGFFACVLLAVVGLWLGLRMGPMFAGTMFALAAWDMTEFRAKLRLLSPREDAKGIERRHLLRLALLTAAGTLLGFLFEWLAVR